MDERRVGSDRGAMTVLENGLHGAHRRIDAVAEIGRRRLESSIRDGTLRVMWRQIVIDPSRFLDPWTLSSAGLLLAGPFAAVCGPTAAVLHGYDAIEGGTTHLVAPYHVRVANRPGLVVHRGSCFERDVIELAGLRILRPERVAAELLCSTRAGDALALTDQVLRRAGKEHERVRKEIASCLRRRPDPRGTVRAARLLDLASPSAASPAESRFRLRLIEDGFPLPEVNWKLYSVRGQLLWKLDLAWPQLRIAVEYDGVDSHAGREAEDAAREADLRRRGWVIVRARAEDFRDLTRVARELRAAFRLRGYVW